MIFLDSQINFAMHYPGIPIIFLHAFPLNHRMWQPQMEFLQARDIGYLAPDLIADYVAQFYDRDTTPEMAEKGMAAFAQFWTNTGKIDSILAQLEKDRALIFAPAK